MSDFPIISRKVDGGHNFIINESIQLANIATCENDRFTLI